MNGLPGPATTRSLAFTSFSIDSQRTRSMISSDRGQVIYTDPVHESTPPSGPAFMNNQVFQMQESLDPETPCMHGRRRLDPWETQMYCGDEVEKT